MRIPALLVFTLGSTMLSTLPATVIAGPGTLWELRTQVEGMPDMGNMIPAQRVCMPTDTSKPPPTQNECTILEQRSSGNHHWMKVQCPDGTMEMEQTREASSLETKMSLTDESGQTMHMRVNGTAVGSCEYNG